MEGTLWVTMQISRVVASASRNWVAKTTLAKRSATPEIANLARSRKRAVVTAVRKKRASHVERETRSSAKLGMRVNG